jgi:hypothetical protein
VSARFVDRRIDIFPVIPRDLHQSGLGAQAVARRYVKQAVDRLPQAAPLSSIFLLLHQYAETLPRHIDQRIAESELSLGIAAGYRSEGAAIVGHYDRRVRLVSAGDRPLVIVDIDWLLLSTLFPLCLIRGDRLGSLLAAWLLLYAAKGKPNTLPLHWIFGALGASAPNLTARIMYSMLILFVGHELGHHYSDHHGEDLGPAKLVEPSVVPRRLGRYQLHRKSPPFTIELSQRRGEPGRVLIGTDYPSYVSEFAADAFAVHAAALLASGPARNVMSELIRHAAMWQAQLFLLGEFEAWSSRAGVNRRTHPQSVARMDMLIFTLRTIGQRIQPRFRFASFDPILSVYRTLWHREKLRRSLDAALQYVRYTLDDSADEVGPDSWRSFARGHTNRQVSVFRKLARFLDRLEDTDGAHSPAVLAIFGMELEEWTRTHTLNEKPVIVQLAEALAAIEFNPRI